MMFRKRQSAYFQHDCFFIQNTLKGLIKSGTDKAAIEPTVFSAGLVIKYASNIYKE